MPHEIFYPASCSSFTLLILSTHSRRFILSIIPTGPIRPRVARKPFRGLQISTAGVAPPSGVAPGPPRVVRPEHQQQHEDQPSRCHQ